MSANSRPPGHSDDPHDKDTWSKFWRKPSVLFAAVGVALAGAALVSQMAPPKTPPDPLAECRAHHPEADGKPVKTAKPGQHDTYLVQGCRPAGIPGVAEDGLWKAELTYYGIPGTSLADEFTTVEVYSTDCPALGLGYRFSNQSRTQHYRIVVQSEDTVSGNSDSPESIYSPDGVPANAPEELWVMAGTRLLVLNNDRNALETVTCEPLEAVVPRPERSAR